jgi:acetyl/propionyl-CoA carboxylase alpha subunit
MRRALAETRIEGIATAVPFFLELLADPDVIANRLSTQFLDEWRFEPARGERELEDFALVAAALSEVESVRRSRGAQGAPGGSTAGRPSPSSWRSARVPYGSRE